MSTYQLNRPTLRPYKPTGTIVLLALFGLLLGLIVALMLIYQDLKHNAPISIPVGAGEYLTTQGSLSSNGRYKLTREVQPAVAPDGSL